MRFIKTIYVYYILSQLIYYKKKKKCNRNQKYLTISQIELIP